MKTCTKCGATKAKSEFNKRARNRDGLYSWCRACANTATADWRVDNPGYNAAWHAANTDKEKERKRVAAWRVANPERITAYRSANAERSKEVSAAYRAANPEACRTYSHNRRARKREAGGKLSPELAIRLFNLQRGKCACCGKPLGDDYHLDHVMPLARGGSNTDDNIQLLRSTCNKQKHAKHPVEFMQQRGFLL